MKVAYRFERPKVYDNNHIGPEVSKHLSQHCQRSFEWTRKPIFVFVHNQKRINLFDL